MRRNLFFIQAVAVLSNGRGLPVCDAVAESEQAVRKMDIFKFYIGGGGGKLHIGKVPEPPDAQIDQTVGNVLGHGLGNGQNHHIHTVLPDETVQIVHRINRHTVDRGADNSGGDIKSGVHGKTSVGEWEVLQQGMTQVAHADHDQVVVVVHAQNVTDLSTELLHIIAVALLSELAETAEILADLRGGDVHLLAQRMGGDADHAAVAQVSQLAVISGKTPDNSVRDVLFFQKDHSCFKDSLKYSQI